MKNLNIKTQFQISFIHRQSFFIIFFLPFHLLHQSFHHHRTPPQSNLEPSSPHHQHTPTITTKPKLKTHTEWSWETKHEVITHKYKMTKCDIWEVEISIHQYLQLITQQCYIIFISTMLVQGHKNSNTLVKLYFSSNTTLLRYCRCSITNTSTRRLTIRTSVSNWWWCRKTTTIPCRLSCCTLKTRWWVGGTICRLCCTTKTRWWLGRKSKNEKKKARFWRKLTKMAKSLLLFPLWPRIRTREVKSILKLPPFLCLELAGALAGNRLRRRRTTANGET